MHTDLNILGLFGLLIISWCTKQAYIKYFSSWQHAFIQNKFPATLHVSLLCNNEICGFIVF